MAFVSVDQTSECLERELRVNQHLEIRADAGSFRVAPRVFIFFEIFVEYVFCFELVCEPFVIDCVLHVHLRSNCDYCSFIVLFACDIEEFVKRINAIVRRVSSHGSFESAVLFFPT